MLRPLGPNEKGHPYQYLEWSNNPDLHELRSGEPYVQEWFWHFFKRFENRYIWPEPRAEFIEIYANDGVLIGAASIAKAGPDAHQGSIGLLIGEQDYWPENDDTYARESLALLVRYGFETHNLLLLTARSLGHNVRFKRVLLDVGFEPEARPGTVLHRDRPEGEEQSFFMLHATYLQRKQLLVDCADDEHDHHALPFQAFPVRGRSAERHYHYVAPIRRSLVPESYRNPTPVLDSECMP